MTIVCVFTDSYAPYAHLLKESLDKHGYGDYLFSKHPNQESWAEGVRLRQTVILNLLQRCDCPHGLLLVDADTLLLRPPPKIEAEGDICAYWYENGGWWCGGTVLYRNTEPTKAMLRRCINKKQSWGGDQGVFNEAIEEAIVLDDLKVGKLSAQWVCMDGYPEEDVENPIIRHFMAHRLTLEKHKRQLI